MKNPTYALLTALQKLADECQASRKYIVLNDPEGFAAYKGTAKALQRAWKVLKKEAK